ncbi:MAG TPA: restriction endonuclease subunit S, partial [Variovorax sp.]
MNGSAPTAKLAEVAELNPPLGASLRDGDDVSFMPMAAVDADSVTAVDRETRSYSEVSKGYTPFIDGDVLVAKITPCFENGKIAQARLSRRYGFGSTEFHVVRPRSDRVDARYLVHFLRQERIRKQGESRMTGSAGQRRVPEHFLAGLTIPLPPLPEQRRIAEILDKADALRAKRRAALAQLDSLTQSIFLDMFGDPATNPKGWPVDALRNIADTTSGGTPKRDVDAYFGGPIPWVKSGELHQAVVSATEESLTERGLTESSAKLMPPGTLLVAMYGATVGAVAILGVEAATNQAICCINPSQAVTSEYLAHLLRRMAPSLLA